MIDKNLYILENLRDELELMHTPSIITQEDGTNFLKAELTELGRAGHSVLLEVFVTPYEVDETEALVQFFTTIASDIDEENFVPALCAINNINFSLSVGALHLLEESKQMFHKYSVPIQGFWDEDTVNEICTAAMNSCIDLLDVVYDEAIIIANDVNQLPYYRELIEKEAAKKAELDEMLY